MNKKEIKEICQNLDLSIPTICDSIYLFEIFSKLKKIKYSKEVIQCTAIFISSKLHEQEMRIRDIINVVFFEKNRNKIILENNTENLQNNTYIKSLINRDYSDLKTVINTMYNLNVDNYFILKNDILYAELDYLKEIKFNLNIGTYSLICSMIQLCQNYFYEFSFCGLIIDVSLNILYDLLENDNIEIDYIIKEKDIFIKIIFEIGSKIVLEKYKNDTGDIDLYNNLLKDITKCFENIDNYTYNKILVLIQNLI